MENDYEDSVDDEADDVDEGMVVSR